MENRKLVFRESDRLKIELSFLAEKNVEKN